MTPKKAIRFHLAPRVGPNIMQFMKHYFADHSLKWQLLQSTLKN